MPLLYMNTTGCFVQGFTRSYLRFKIVLMSFVSDMAQL